MRYYCLKISQCILASSTTTSTMKGTCFTASECTANGGKSSGFCASGKNLNLI